MSRVRILNLPNDCTEEQLKQHVLRTAPSSAPPLDITDVRIIRQQQQQQQPSSQQKGKPHHNSSNSNKNVPQNRIRMAFIGFQSSAAGHFVVDYFNNTFFRSAKIRVEAAKGLNDVGVTLNMRKKQEKEEEWKAKKNSSSSSGGGGGSTSSGSTGTAVKRARDEETGSVEQEANGKETSAFKKDRREMFIAERTKATEGPSWATEVLVPQGVPEGLADGHDASNIAATADNRVVTGEAVDEEELERRALEKQQVLGEVDDMAFLSMIGGGAGDNEKTLHSSNHEKEEREEQVRGSTAHGAGRSTDEGEEVDRVSGEDEAEVERHHHHHHPAASSSEAQQQEDMARESRRVRLGNIPYIATEDNIKQFASSLVGPVEHVHIPLTKDTKQSKGAVFVMFVDPEDAVRALQLCRGAILMGRLLRVSAAEEDPHSKRVLAREAQRATTAALGDVAGSSEFKKKKELEKRQQQQQDGSSGHITWNTMYMNSSAAVDAMASRLGVKSEDVVGVQAKGAAVRAAIAEAYLTTEVQQVLSDEGIALDVLDSGQLNLLKPRSNTTILVKNLQLKTPEEAAELSKMFVRFGALETSAFPSAGTFALFRYTHPQDARVAFSRLAYKLFKNAPLFLEWAPVGAIVEEEEGQQQQDAVGAKKQKKLSFEDDSKKSTTGNAEGEDADEEEEVIEASNAAKTAVYTLFITNIPFTTTEDDFYAFLLDICPRLAKAPEKSIKRLAMQADKGRAFLTLEDQSTLAYCQARINGKTFEGRVLACVVSKQTTAAAAAAGLASSAAKRTAAEEDEEDVSKATAVIAKKPGSNTGNSKVPPGCDPLKIIIKNLPFEATEKDVRELVSAFSEVRSVRVPRKSHNFTTHRENNHRGFAFVEFMSEAEAARALEVLKATHLYGRHLVLQYAKMDG